MKSNNELLNIPCKVSCCKVDFVFCPCVWFGGGLFCLFFLLCVGKMLAVNPFSMRFLHVLFAGFEPQCERLIQTSV